MEGRPLDRPGALEVSATTRPCKAGCNGTGNAAGLWSLGGMEAPRDCLACQGIGQVTEHIPVLDQFVDWRFAVELLRASEVSR